MKKKPLLPRLLLSSFLTFLGVFLLSFSCEDHVTPEVPADEAPIIRTIGVNIGSNTVQFNLVFDKAGNIPVVEHGILYRVSGFGASGIVPTESDSKVMFDLPISTTKKSKQHDISTDGTTRLFYRAYAKLSNGNMIYGETFNSQLITE